MTGNINDCQLSGGAPDSVSGYCGFDSRNQLMSDLKKADIRDERFHLFSQRLPIQVIMKTLSAIDVA